MPRLVYNICINSRVHTSFNVFSLSVRYTCRPITIVTNIVLNRSYLLSEQNLFVRWTRRFYRDAFVHTQGYSSPAPDTVVIRRRFLTLSPQISFFRGVNAVCRNAGSDSRKNIQEIINDTPLLGHLLFSNYRFCRLDGLDRPWR